MTRKKVRLAFITNDSARKATYKKRKHGLLKKVHEISTLCDVDACVIIYSPYEAQPVLWPPSDTHVQRVLGLFRSMPEMDQSKKMVNQQTFLRERIVKIKEQLKKLIKDNREKEMVEILFQCLLGTDMSFMSILDLNDLAWLIDSFIRDIILASEKIKRAGGANVVHANAARSHQTGNEDDIKPPIHGVNPSMVNPAVPTTRGAAPFSINAMQNQAAPDWPYKGGFVSNYCAPSGSNNQPYMIPLHQFNMGGIAFNNTCAGATSSNNQPLGIIPGVTNEMMQPRPTQYNAGAFVFNNDGAGALASNKNTPSGLSVVNTDMMMMMPPSQFNMGRYVDNSGASSSSSQMMRPPPPPRSTWVECHPNNPNFFTE